MEITKEMQIRFLEDMCNKLEEYLPGNIVGVQPLDIHQLPKSQITLYVVSTGINSHYFKTESDGYNWISTVNPKYFYCYRVDYLGDIMDKSDVVKETDKDGNIRLVSISDTTEYDVYNFEKSKLKGKYVWDHYIDSDTNKIELLMTINEMLEEKDKKLIK